MVKQDQLAAAVCVGRLGIVIAPNSVIEPDDVDIRIAAAVRSFMGCDEAVERSAMAIVELEYDCEWRQLSDRARSEEKNLARAALSAALGDHTEYSAGVGGE